MTSLRSPLLRRIVAGLAFAGLVLPLAPTASARGVATDRLVEALGHREAVEIAVAASQNAASPARAFLEAYFEATGEDADAVLARLDGEAWWLLTEPLAPIAVLVTASSTSLSQITSPGTGLLAFRASQAHSLTATGAPPSAASSEVQPLAFRVVEQPRGP